MSERVTTIAENIDTTTPSASVSAKPCTSGAWNVPSPGIRSPPPRK